MLSTRAAALMGRTTNNPNNKTMPPSSRSNSNAKAHPILRFAHPFFTPTPVEQRPLVPKTGQRMLDHIQGTLHPIPAIKRNNAQWSLDEVIGKEGTAAIQAAGKIIIHLAGDTGVPETDHETQQVLVADAMSKDYVVNAPESSPASSFSTWVM